jgi:hypothetical protein
VNITINGNTVTLSNDICAAVVKQLAADVKRDTEAARTTVRQANPNYEQLAATFEALAVKCRALANS